MKTLNYCIATFEGKIPSRTRDSYSEDILDKHLRHLASLDTTIDQITIIVPTCNMEKYENYYRFSEWEGLFPKTSVKILPFDYPELYSYGQWIHAYQNFPNFDYYFVIEDDYVANSKDFKEKLFQFLNRILEKLKMAVISVLLLRNTIFME